MARRQSPVFRNLDDTLKILGLLSLKSCGLVFFLYATCYGADLIFDLWGRLFGRGGFIVELALIGGAALALAYAEKQDDEHLVPAMIRFYLRRQDGVLYSGARNDGWPKHEFEWVLEQRRAPRRPPSHETEVRSETAGRA